MITKLEIEKKALEFVAEGEAPLWGRGFVDGATWASQKNEKELAAVRAAMNGQKKALEMVIEQNKALRAENAKLREALSDVVFGLKNAETIGEIDIAQETAQDALNSTSPDPLYSSAPEMLEALETVVSGYETDGMEGMREMDKVFYKTCTDVIEKATKPA